MRPGRGAGASAGSEGSGCRARVVGSSVVARPCAAHPSQGGVARSGRTMPPCLPIVPKEYPRRARPPDRGPVAGRRRRRRDERIDRRVGVAGAFPSGEAMTPRVIRTVARTVNASVLAVRWGYAVRGRGFREEVICPADPGQDRYAVCRPVGRIGARCAGGAGRGMRGSARAAVSRRSCAAPRSPPAPARCPARGWARPCAPATAASLVRCASGGPAR